MTNHYRPCSAHNAHDDSPPGRASSDERSPLLNADANAPTPVLVEASSKFPRRNLLLCGAFILLPTLLQSGSSLQLVPFNQVLENAICRRLYPDLDLLLPAQSGHCSNNEAVQAELSLLRGWQNTLDLIPGILTVVPYGFMADRYGRKFGICLCTVGIVLSSCFYASVCWWSDIVPVRLTWVSSLFTLIGGGTAVMLSILFSVLSDLAPEAYRSTTFFAIAAASLSADLSMSVLTPSLMKFNIWLPILIGIGFHILTILFAFCLPETLRLDSLTDESASNPTTHNGREERDGEEPEVGKKHDFLWTRWSATLHNLQTASVIFIRGHKRVALLLFTILITTLGRMAQELLLQFVRKRFGWSWTKTGYLPALKAGLMLLLLVVILPLVNYIFTNLIAIRPIRKDLNVARISCLLLLLGNLAIGFSPTDRFMLFGVVTSSMGAAYDLTLRSLLSQLVDASHRATLFTTVAMFECIGGVIAGPLLAISYQVGLRLGGMWIGLPFFLSGLLCTCSLCILYIA